MSMVDQDSAFRQALRDHLQAISSRDIERFGQTLHRDVRLIGPTGSIMHGYDDAVAAHRGWFIEGGWGFEPTRLLSIPYAVFCLETKNLTQTCDGVAISGNGPS